jgi:hypothetical protein
MLLYRRKVSAFIFSLFKMLLEHALCIFIYLLYTCAENCYFDVCFPLTMILKRNLGSVRFKAFAALAMKIR